jgi:hypothetical protein
MTLQALVMAMALRLGIHCTTSCNCLSCNLHTGGRSNQQMPNTGTYPPHRRNWLLVESAKVLAPVSVSVVVMAVMTMNSLDQICSHNKVFVD